MTITSRSDENTDGLFAVSPQQAAYFQTFGFLHIPGAFKDDMETIAAGFEEVFEDERHEQWELFGQLHGQQRRVIIPQFIDKSAKLSWLRQDARVLAVAGALAGPGFEYAESDGNLWFCETYWHTDIFGSPMEQRHVKLSFYLDELDGTNGAIRLIPGTNHFNETFAKTLREKLAHHAAISDVYGVDGAEIPSWTLCNVPGDLIIWNQRTIHASYEGNQRRRSFAITFREARQ